MEPGIYKKGEITLETIIKEFKKLPELKSAGDMGIFTGIVRNIGLDGEAISKIVIESYEEMANDQLKKICNELKNEPGVIAVTICHLIGEFKVGEDLVYVVIATAHREELFKTLKIAVNRYKSDVHIWKKEILVNGQSRWIK